MIDFFYKIDLSLFYFINHTLSNPFFDKVFPLITDVKSWYIAYIILFLLLVIKGGRLGRIAAVMVILLVVASDQLSSTFLKSLFERVRPCNAIDDAKILVTCTQSYSFPSSHAVNNFAGAVYFSRLFPKYRISFYLVAVLMAFSRPYVGVHYPSDVIGGALIGALVGYIFSIGVIYIDKFISKKTIKITNKYQRAEFK